jgi:hypothetical protein
MTSRQSLQKAHRIAWPIVIVGIVLMAVPEMKWLQGVGIVLLFAGILWGKFAGKCVHCLKPAGAWMHSASPGVRYCPCCGKSLDAEHSAI